MGGQLQFANIYDDKECGSMACYPSSVLSVQLSTGTETKKKRVIDRRSKKV